MSTPSSLVGSVQLDRRASRHESARQLALKHVFVWVLMRPLHTPNQVPTSLIKVLDGPLGRKHHWQIVSSYSAEEHADASCLHALLAVASANEGKT